MGSRFHHVEGQFWGVVRSSAMRPFVHVIAGGPDPLRGRAIFGIVRPAEKHWVCAAKIDKGISATAAADCSGLDWPVSR